MREYFTGDRKRIVNELYVMNMLWVCYGYVMSMLWVCYDDMLWVCYDYVMSMLWVCYEYDMGML